MAATHPGPRLPVVVATALVLLVTACSASDGSKAVAIGPTEAPAAVPAQWVTTAAEHVVPGEKLSPPVATRLLAYTAVALHEAASTSSVTDSEPLGGRLTGLPKMTHQGDRAVDPAAAAATAARDVVLGLLGAEASEQTRWHVEALHAEQLRQLAAGPVTAEVLTSSKEHGARVARNILDWAGSDGFADRGRPYEVPTGPGVWELAPPATSPVEPYWGTLRPFAVEPASVPAPLPPAYFADPNSQLASQARQVHEASLSLTEEQRDTARFWEGAPAVRWMTVAADLVQQAPDLELTTATEVLALTGIALADGTIVAWADKYEYLVVRPVTYIQRHIDPTWTPLLPTPGHPEFPAGHSASSMAAATVLEGLLAPEQVMVRDVTGQQPTREFGSFAEAAAEVAMSRVYAGAHYPLGLEAGADQGRRVGKRVLDLARSGAG